jgi:hypothetical protein
VYLNSGFFDKKDTYLLCQIPDKSFTMATATTTEGDVKQQAGMHHLWQFCGYLSIVVTPYHPGRHWAESAGDFLPIVKQLQALHATHYVHGDPRAYNMVFVDKTTGHLLDFDMGGKDDGTTKYPVGFKMDLPDGERVGKAGHRITMDDDWFALTSVIFRCHEFKPPAILSGQQKEELAGSLLENKALSDFQYDTGTHIEKLVSFLEYAQANNWTVLPKRRFKVDLEEYFGYVQGGQRAKKLPGTYPGTHTRSPQNEKK